MLISQYESRTGKEKVIANEKKGQRGPEKYAHFVPAITTVSEKKTTAKKTTWFLSDLPLPRRGLTWFYKEHPLPLNEPRGLCAVPNLKLL